MEQVQSDGIFAEDTYDDHALYFNDDGVKSQTSEVQQEIEEAISMIYGAADVKSNLILYRTAHEKWLRRGLQGIGSGFQGLDSSRPWILFWILHSLELLDSSVAEYEDRVISFLSQCQDAKGGFAGGPGQLAHLAPTYAAVLTLAILGTEKAYNMINRQTLSEFLHRVKMPDGSFLMHDQGEVDVRGAYCALTVAHLLNIMTPELTNGTAEYISKCQSYEGGFGAEPGNEAHGGYTFCALAALVLLGRKDVIDVGRLVSWAISRQMKYEGGFQGRTNKLVDSCYSLWQGGIYPLIDALLQSENATTPRPDPDGSWLFGQRDLQKYVLLCCQDLKGGIRDKPGKGKDFYHTCYALSGLSIAQNNRPDVLPTVLGDHYNNWVEPTHPVFNVHPDKVVKMFSYFENKGL